MARWYLGFAVVTAAFAASTLLLDEPWRPWGLGFSDALVVGTLLGMGYLFLAFYRIAVFEARSLAELKALASERLVNLEFAERVVGAPYFLAGLTFMLSCYATWKPEVLGVYPAPLDKSFAAIDRYLHFGDPWRWTHNLPSPLTVYVDQAYGRWYSVLLGAVLIVAIARPLAERARFFWALGLLYLVGGTVLAMLLSSGGPAFYYRLTGGTEFVPLTDRLVGTTARLLQQRLWYAHVDPAYAMYFRGISAMPSLHVGVAVLLALWARGIHRLAGYLAVAYAIVIMFGSVYLGWHYAIDGYVAAGLAAGCWYLAGRVVAGQTARDHSSLTPGRTLAGEEGSMSALP